MEAEQDTIVAEMVAVDTAERSRLGELYVRHAPDGMRLAYLLTGNEALAEDLVQDAFVRLVGQLRHLRYPDAFAAYLRQTIVNLSRSHFRHLRVERAYLERISREPELRADPNDDLDEAMHTALLRLPERQRIAIVLRFYEDLSDVQTAEVLGCPTGTVRSLVSRGMRSLRGQIEGSMRR